MDLERVGIRELRNNLKEYLDRIEQGDSIEITKNRRTIGMLVPKHPDQEAIERLVAEGKLIPPKSGRYGVHLPQRVVAPPGSPSLSEILDEMRRDVDEIPRNAE